MKQKRKKIKGSLLQTLISSQSPYFYLGAIELKREGYKINSANFNKLMKRATKIRNTFQMLKRKRAYTSRIGKTYVSFVKEKGTVKEYKQILKEMDRAKKR